MIGEKGERIIAIYHHHMLDSQAGWALGRGQQVAAATHMRTWMKELRAQQKYASPPGAYLTTKNHTGKNVVAWW